MAKIKLTDGFNVIPEGTYIFKITGVAYKEEFGKMEVSLETATGKKHIERYSLMNKDGDMNQGAAAAFSYLAKCALNDFDRTEIDEQELVGHYIKAVVTHDVLESKNKPGQTVTFAHLGDKEPANGFENDDVPASTPKKPAAKKPTNYNLADILG